MVRFDPPPRFSRTAKRAEQKLKDYMHQRFIISSVFSTYHAGDREPKLRKAYFLVCIPYQMLWTSKKNTADHTWPGPPRQL